MAAISRKLTFISDPGHGWLEVPMKDVNALGIRADISCHSFIKGDNAYLEEDADCGVYFQAVERAGIPSPEIVFRPVEHFERGRERF